ncbi:saccharopine dehydrogenase [Chloropicon primus]|uniref:Saccharopine dehydrogenase n=1 Tax=Chloropicon primus TaxID=1764295 RepID=A0A5B8MTM6_9CHLO|nr:saccharopine dehydrogenase [Chloropicon primus]UPR01996.1 saccharopine dehydrogenase [Chloropicon primus]|mmetsp:Transcript_3491/g.9811  ORF Transcript_3491/g.9811 Transcript_3491/m.9811 type:complete len:430 (-) Transcript_3491:72-1361(-)|eukprot:QDZ22772.1 saccharopine dehydrogenase [Chloropicon primus]
MKSREYDIVVFGATGFTGEYILKEVAKSSSTSLRIAAAGRTATKVESVIERVTPAERQVKCIVADVNDVESLFEMARRTKLVINAVGPYRKYGENVVKACVECSTHVLDICGEPEFIEKMDMLYGGEEGLAAKNGCYVVSAVGFDSVPCDLGTLHNQREMEKLGWVPSSVSSYLSVSSGSAGMAVHYATWEALVLGFANAGNLKSIRKSVSERNAKCPGEAVAPVGPKPKRASGAVWNERLKSWALPFLGSDASVVRRTQRALGLRGMSPVHHSCMFTVQSRTTVGLFGMFGAMMKQLIKSGFGRNMLLSHPSWFSWGLFSHKGPTKEQIDQTSFEFTFVGKGYGSKSSADSGGKQDKFLVTTLSGPEPGYVACSVFIAEAAYTVLEEDLEQHCGFGVRTTGELFSHSTYLDRLQKNGISITNAESGDL